MSQRETWPIEIVPDEGLLFIRIHRQWFRKDGRIALGFFRNRPDERTGAMSTDWERYSTPEEARSRAKKPSENAVGRLVAGDVRQIPMQEIGHSPIQNDPLAADNRAHVDIRGPKEETDLDVQDRFSRIATVVLGIA